MTQRGRGGDVDGGISWDRVAGALVGLATGDALGAPYEFSVPGRGADIAMKAGGPWELGEWTDDTAQAVAIAEVTATGSLDPIAIGQRFLDWYRAGPKDVGISTSAVLSLASTPEQLAGSAAAYLARNPKGGAGNGSLMRTAPVALACLGDDDAIAEHASRISSLTHADPLAAEACVLWCVAIDRAIREQRLDGVRDGLSLLPADRAAYWEERLDEAEARDPHDFSHHNGFVVTALQAAHAVITQTPVPTDQPSTHLRLALEEAVRIGNDTDTVAAIAGQVLGAYWGASAIPWAWRRHLHGWPGLREHDLVRLAVLTGRGGHSDGIGWPDADALLPGTRHDEPTPVCAPLETDGPDGDHVLLGNLPGLEVALERGADAVVSLCRVGRREVPEHLEHARFWLVDQADADANPNLEAVLSDAANAVAALRAEGRRVFVHCVGGRSRTPTVAALYLAGRDGISRAEALRQVEAALPEVRLNPRFTALLR